MTDSSTERALPSHNADLHPDMTLVQASKAGMEFERAQIVEWLQGTVAPQAGTSAAVLLIRSTARDIEKGDHHA